MRRSHRLASLKGMRILGPMLVTGAVVSGGVVLSLFIDPRAADERGDGSTTDEPVHAVLVSTTSDAPSPRHDVAFDRTLDVDASAPESVPLVALRPARAIRSKLDAVASTHDAGPNTSTLRPFGSLAGFALRPSITTRSDGSFASVVRPAALRPALVDEHRRALRAIDALELDPACVLRLAELLHARGGAEIAADDPDLRAAVGERANDVAAWLANAASKPVPDAPTKDV